MNRRVKLMNRQAVGWTKIRQKNRRMHGRTGDSYCVYCNEHKFSDSQAYANSADPDQPAPRRAA